MPTVVRCNAGVISPPFDAYLSPDDEHPAVGSHLSTTTAVVDAYMGKRAGAYFSRETAQETAQLPSGERTARIDYCWVGLDWIVLSPDTGYSAAIVALTSPVRSTTSP